MILDQLPIEAQTYKINYKNCKDEQKYMGLVRDKNWQTLKKIEQAHLIQKISKF